MHPKPIPTMNDILKEQATLETTSAKPKINGDEGFKTGAQEQQHASKGGRPVKESLKYDYPKTTTTSFESKAIQEESSVTGDSQHRHHSHHEQRDTETQMVLQDEYDGSRADNVHGPKIILQENSHRVEGLTMDHSPKGEELAKQSFGEENLPKQPVLQYVRIFHKEDEEEEELENEVFKAESAVQRGHADDQIPESGAENNVVVSLDNSPLNGTFVNEVLMGVQAVQELNNHMTIADERLPSGYLETEINGFNNRQSLVGSDEVSEPVLTDLDLQDSREHSNVQTVSNTMENQAVEAFIRAHSPRSETPVRVLSIKRLTEQELEQNNPKNERKVISDDDSNASSSDFQTSDDETSGFYDVSKAMDQLEENFKGNKGKGDADGHTVELATTVVLERNHEPSIRPISLTHSEPSVVPEPFEPFNQQTPMLITSHKPEKAEIIVIKSPDLDEKFAMLDKETTDREDSCIFLRNVQSENDLCKVSYDELKTFLGTYGVSTEPGLHKSVLINRASMIWRLNQRASDRSSNGGQTQTQDSRVSTESSGVSVNLEDLKDYENYEMFGYSNVVVASSQTAIKEVPKMIKEEESKSNTKFDSKSSDEDTDDDEDVSEGPADMVTVEEFLEDLAEMEENIAEDTNLILPSTKPEEDVIAGILLRRSLSRQDSNSLKSPTTPKSESGLGRDSDVFVDAETEFRMSQSPASTLEWTSTVVNSAPVQTKRDMLISVGKVKEAPDEDDYKDLMETSRGLSAEIPLRHLQDDGRVYASGRSSWIVYLESLTENQVNNMEEFKLRAILKSLNITKHDLWKREDLVNAVKKVWKELKKPEPKRNLSEVLDDKLPDGVQRHPSTTSLNSLSSIQSLSGITLEDIQSEKDIDTLTTRNLRAILEHYGVAVDTLVLRKHFISEVKKLWGRTKTLEDYGLHVEVTPRRTSSSSTSTSSTSKTKPSKIPVALNSPSKRVSDDVSLKKISSEKDIERMSYQTLKTVLQSQGLPVKMEESKQDLILRTKVVWTSHNLGTTHR